MQRERLLANDRFAAEPGWESVTGLQPDAMSRVDTIAVDDEVVLYNYRVVTFADMGGPAVSLRGACRLERDKRGINLVA